MWNKERKGKNTISAFGGPSCIEKKEGCAGVRDKLYVQKKKKRRGGHGGLETTQRGGGEKREVIST